VQQSAFGAHDANFLPIRIDALRECAQVVAAIAASFAADAPAGLPGECLERMRCEARPGASHRILSPLCVGVGLSTVLQDIANDGGCIEPV